MNPAASLFAIALLLLILGVMSLRRHAQLHAIGSAGEGRSDGLLLMAVVLLFLAFVFVLIATLRAFHP